MGFKEAAVEFWEKTYVCECAELQEAEGKEQHGFSTRTVRERHVRYFFRTRVICTGRAREKQTAWVFNTGHVREACNFHLLHTGQQHGPCPLVSVARVSSTGRVREACVLIPSIARGVLINTDRVHILACTGLRGFARGAFLGSARGVQIGTGHACRLKYCFKRRIKKKKELFFFVLF